MTERIPDEGEQFIITKNAVMNLCELRLETTKEKKAMTFKLIVQLSKLQIR